MFDSVLNKIIDLTWNLVKLIGGLYLLLIAIVVGFLIVMAILGKGHLGRRLDSMANPDDRSQDIPRFLNMRRIYRSDRARWADLVRPEDIPHQAAPPLIETTPSTNSDDTKFIAAIKGFNDTVQRVNPTSRQDGTGQFASDLDRYRHNGCSCDDPSHS